MRSVNWKWFVLLLVLGSGCKKSGILSSKNVKILGNFKVNFNLVAKDFKVTRQYHPDLVPFREKFLSLAADQGYHISSKAVSGLRKMILPNSFPAELLRTWQRFALHELQNPRVYSIGKLLFGRKFRLSPASKRNMVLVAKSLRLWSCTSFFTAL